MIEGRALPFVAALLLAGAWGCGTGDPEPSNHDHGPAAAGWSVTAWGERFEVFPEAGALVAGEVVDAHVHVTRLEGFEPLAEGSVEVRFGTQVFRADAPERPGIFTVPLQPTSTGEFDLLFRIDDGAAAEEIRGGRVRVGSAGSPGGIVVAPAPRGASQTAESQDFGKEAQWQSAAFATAWVRSGRLAGSLVGPARLRPTAGGEAWITAPVDGVVKPAGRAPWPFQGRTVARKDPLFEVVPRIAADRSLPVLEADAADLRVRLESARARSQRLEELLVLEAVGARDVEEARVRVQTLEAKHGAAAEDLEAARALRSGKWEPAGLTLRAPFAGAVARVEVRPGAGVSAGDPLARVVRTDRVWIEVAFSPGEARALLRDGVRGVVLEDPEQGVVRLEAGVSLVSVAPETSPETGTVGVLLEAPAVPGWAFGTTAEARVLTRRENRGIVVPASAVIDDGGVWVVYLQLAGESFVRQEVVVAERQGDRVRVEGLVPGQRLVVSGGESIRRASLMATGESHGHVH